MDALKASIAELGLRTPITVMSQSDGPDTRLILVAGLHRLEAVRQLGDETIECVVIDDDPVEAELWEIAENLHRADLTKEQRDEQIRRYAVLIERKEAAATECRTSLADGRVAGPQHQPGTAKRVAKETGLNIRTVQRGEVSTQIASKPQGGRPQGVASKIAAETGLSADTVRRALNPARVESERARSRIDAESARRAIPSIAGYVEKDSLGTTKGKSIAARHAGERLALWRGESASKARFRTYSVHNADFCS